MADLPLINGFDPGVTFAYRENRPIRVGEFLSDVRRLADSLPDRRFVLNLCTDRYHFAVVFAAAVSRGQANLLPPNSTPDMIGRVRLQYGSMYCVTDGAEPADLETIVYRRAAGDGRIEPAAQPIPETQVAAIIFTSGSTGQPVPHAQTWGSLVRSALAGIDRLGLRALRGMAMLGTVPPQHMFGLEATVLMAMQGGLVLHSGRPFFAADICAEIEALPRPRGLVTTPVHLRVLLAEAGDLPPLDFLLCATAPLPPQLAAQAETRFRIPLHEIYGCTETGKIATRRAVQTHEWQLLPGVTLRKTESGTWVGGGHIEKEALLGDDIESLGAGAFVLHGRTADLINIAGKRTSLAALNYHLNSISGVQDGTFVMPQEDDGTVTRLTAFVVAPGLDGEAILAALRQRIDAAFLPRPLCFVDSLPRNETGKLPRVALDDLVARLAAKVE
jgi:acyl-coenzyme A synthetase/AMP-(fatty) acid ligase